MSSHADDLLKDTYHPLDKVKKYSKEHRRDGNRDRKDRRTSDGAISDDLADEYVSRQSYAYEQVSISQE